MERDLGRNYSRTIWILILGVLTLSVTAAYDTTSAGNLQTALLTGYYSFLRPSSQTNVTLGFGVASVNDMNIITQTIYLNGFLLVSWTDPRLAWTPASYGNMSDTMMKISSIWVPPLLLSNSVDGVKVISDDDDIADIPVKVKSDGLVIWILPANFMASCSANIEFYPFDLQSCTLIVSSWMYVSSEVNIVADGSTSVNTDLYEVNGEWDWISSSVENDARSLHGHPHPTVEFTIKLQRKHSYYLLNILLPMFILNYLGLCVFLLPAESGEKIGCTITVLLSLSVVMTIVSDKIPTTSTNICVLSVYLLTAFILSSLECSVTVLVLRFHHLEEKGYKVSTTLQPYIGKTANFICWRKCHSDDELTAHYLKGSRKDSRSTKHTATVHARDSDNKVRLVDAHNTCQGLAASNGQSNNSVALSKTQTSKVEYSYRDLAMILDQVSLYVFGVLTVIVTIVYMLVLTLGDS